MPNKQAFCKTCNKQVQAHQEESKQGCALIFGHLCMCLLTSFIWLPVWLITAMHNGNPYRCPFCNEVTK